MPRVLGFVISTLGWLLLGAFVAAYLGYYVPPETVWSLQVLALGLPIISIALIPLSILAFLSRKPALASALVVALVLFGLRHFPFGLVSERDPGGGGEEMHVLTYNSKSGNTLTSSDQTLIDLIRETEPDVACLQEYLVIPRRSVREPSGSLTRYLTESGYRTATGVSRTQPETRRPIFSLYPVLDEEILPLGRTIYSYAVRAVLDGPGGQFAVYNLHLRGFTTDRPWREGSVLDPRDWVDFFQKSRGSYLLRAAEARALRRHLQTETLPFLVCGDLNTTSNQWDYRHISRGLLDAFETAGNGWGKTYHARFPIVRIDYVMASGGWMVVSSDVLRPRLSDHRPLTATLKMR